MVSYMDPLKRQAMRNAYRVIQNTKPGQPIDRDWLIEELGRPVPPPSGRESDHEILAAYEHYVTNAGVQHVHRVVSYDQAAAISGKSVEAIRQAAYRGSIRKTTVYREGKGKRVGVYLYSLRNWCGWTAKEFQEAVCQLDDMREVWDAT